MMLKPALKAAVLGLSLTLPFAVAANEDLAKANNCLACHTVDNKILGPAFKDVAAKYKGDESAAAALTEKVMKGGSGNWGSIPMPPNPMVSEENAATLVEWVLSLQ